MAGWLEKILRNILKHRSMASSQTLRFLAVSLGLAVGLWAGSWSAAAQSPSEAVMMPLSAPAAAPATTPAQPVLDPFQVRAVPVDVTAASVTEARERGLTQGRVTAFRTLVDRMTLRENAAGISMPNTNQIIDMILEFSVANERSSAVRYLADLSVRFNPNAVRAFLRSQNIPFAETASRPMVIVPVLKDSTGGTLLWQDSNLWRETWLKLIPLHGLVPLVLPLGDLDDISLLSADQAVTKDTNALNRLAAKYNAAGVIVAVATMPSSSSSITVALSEVRPLGSSWEGRANVAIAAGLPREDALGTAAQDAANAIEEGWKQRNMLKFGEGGQLTALIPITTLNDWLAIKARLANVPVVERVELQAMSKNLVQAVIGFAGDESQLQFAMGQHDLDLTADGDMWMLRTVSSRTAPSAEPAAETTPPSPAQ